MASYYGNLAFIFLSTSLTLGTMTQPRHMLASACGHLFVHRRIQERWAQPDWLIDISVMIALWLQLPQSLGLQGEPMMS